MSARGSHSRRKPGTLRFLRGAAGTLLQITLAVAVGVVAVTYTPNPALGKRTSAAVITVTGHGWGHGRGAGQFGAAGYAVIGQEGYQWILAHYFSNTTMQTTTDRTISVELQNNAFGNIFVYSPVAFSISGNPVAAGHEVELALTGPSSWTPLVSTSAVSGCTQGLGYAPVGAPTATSAAQVLPGAGSSLAAMEGETYGDSLVVCYPSGASENVDGYIQAATYVDGSLPQQRTVNVLPIQEYLDGVVPHETPASWGFAGAAGPQGQAWGFQALEVQAVEARSYALSSLGGWYGFSDTCDSNECQVYMGMWNPTSSLAPYYTLSNLAVSDTGLSVMEMSNGSIARTEFSSSTGGYSAGGTFPAVVDQYDNICADGICNTNHTWTATLTQDQIQAAFPQIGTLTEIRVDQRNGEGDMGGRVVTLSLLGSSGSVSLSGDSFASDFGLNSDWYEFSGGVTIVNDVPAAYSPGYWIAGANGTVANVGSAASIGSAPSLGSTQIVGITRTADQGGYWLLGSDGSVYPYGDALSFGSITSQQLNGARPVGLISTSDSKGYWIITNEGKVFPLGDAGFYGSVLSLATFSSIVSVTPGPNAKGYWMLTSSGTVYGFGSAPNLSPSSGSPNDIAIASTPDGNGYWLLASSGAVTSVGDAGNFTGSTAVTGTAVALVPTYDGGGYWIVNSSGAVFPFGDAATEGAVSMSGTTAVGASGS